MTISQAFSLSAVGPGPAILLNDQSTASVVLSNVGGGCTIVPQVTSDSPVAIQAGSAQWVTATTIGAGSITTAGTYVGNVADFGLTGFRIFVSALTSGTISGSIAASDALGLSGGGAVVAHVITDAGSVTNATLQAGSTTAVTQATAANLNATVVGAGVAGTPAGGVVSVQGVASGTPVPASQSGGPWTVAQSNSAGSGTLALQTLNAAVTASLFNGQSAMGWSLVGLTGQSATVTFEVSADSAASWSSTFAVKEGQSAAASTATTDGVYVVNVAGLTNARVRVSTAGATVNATVSYLIGVGANLVSALQAGTWTVQPGNTANTTAWKVDGSAVTQPVLATSATATLTQVASSATTVSLLALNTSRKGYSCFNDSTQVLYIAHAATASTTAYVVQVAAGGFYEQLTTAYTGAVSGIWASANGSARLCEYT